MGRGFLVVWFCIFSSFALGRDILFGVELTFSNRKVASANYGTVGDEYTGSPENREYRDKWRDAMRLICANRGDCFVSKGKRDKYGETQYRVEFVKEGKTYFWYEITLDPYCIEVKTKPSTLKEYEALRDLIDRDLFKVAGLIGLKPGAGGGHIHMGAQSAFFGNPLLLRNFIVDYLRHSELATGAMENDIYNALPFQKLPEESQRRLYEIIRDFDNGVIGSREMVERIQKEVYIGEHKNTKERYDSAKYQALNFTRMVNPKIPEHAKTLELRALRTHQSVDDMIKTVRLFQKRVETLENHGRPIPYFDPQIPPLETRAAMFWEYIRESGLNPMDYRFLLHKSWRKEFEKINKLSCATSLVRLVSTPQ